MEPPNTPEAAPLSPERMDLFVQLLGQNQRRLYLYVVSMVPNRTEAEEILQETNLVLWREFGRFQPGTHFAAWACKVAFHQVLAWRKRKQRDRLQFSEAFLEAVGEEANTAADLLEERSRALAGCIDRLPASHRDLIRWRYSDGLSIEEVSRQAGRTVEAVYRALSRIRQTLYDCVTHSLTQGAGP
jgi:RNA polymerase sigma-70 factor (ECF subfamily)